MIADQRDFVAWWDAQVHRKGGERWLDNADRHDQRLSMEEAEQLTGIKQRQRLAVLLGARDPGQWSFRDLVATAEDPTTGGAALPFDGSANGYQMVTGQFYGDVSRVGKRGLIKRLNCRILLIPDLSDPGCPIEPAKRGDFRQSELLQPKRGPRLHLLEFRLLGSGAAGGPGRHQVHRRKSDG
jgi:hypothetical protein